MKTLITTVLLLGAILLPVSKGFRDSVIHGLTVIASSAERFILRGDYSEIRTIDEGEFDEVIREPGRLVLVVVQKKLNSGGSLKKIDRLLKELPSKVLIAKIKVDKNSALMERLHIQELPSIHIYREGSLLRKFEGDIQASELKEYIDARLTERTVSGDGQVDIRPLHDDWLPPGVEKRKE